MEVKRFGDELVSIAAHKRQEIGRESLGAKSNNADPLRNNLINSLLDHIEDRQIVADAAMNYLSAGTRSKTLSPLGLCSPITQEETQPPNP